jgi:putative N6-adenine-specific DNA methylase
VSPGLEPWLASELDELELPGAIKPGGIELRTSLEQLWRLHHECRLAESIRVRLRPFQARHFSDLIAGLNRLPWHAYLTSTQAVDVRVTCHRSRLWHSEAVAERTRFVLGQHLGLQPSSIRPSNGAESQTVFVRIAGDIVQPSIDASGDRLHRRGHRTHIGVAPLRETLAAALVRMLGSAPNGPMFSLWDPFCGSGCIAIEWVERQLGWSCGRDRAFAFERWPTHDANRYIRWLNSRVLPAAPVVRAYGSDIEEGVLVSAQSNAVRSMVEPYCTWMCGDFESFVDALPRGTAIVTNPPYGIRLGNLDNYSHLLGRFEALLAIRTDLRPVVVLLPNPLRPWRPRLDWQVVAKFRNGGLHVQVLRLD